MPAPIRRLTTDQLIALLETAKPQLTRKIASVHLHHTWRPTQSQFKGLAKIEGMRNFHMNPPNNWRDIAQHLTIDPQGFSLTGRNWNWPPASQPGKNGTAASGPFMIEMIGDFDAGRDVLDGAQRKTAVDVVAGILRVWGLTTADVFFHRELGSPKTCPGTGVAKDSLLAEIEAATTSGARGTAPRRTVSARTAAALPFSREFLL